MRELIKEYERKINSVAIQYGIVDVSIEVVHIEDHRPHYEIGVWLGDKVFTESIYNRIEARHSFDDLYDKAVLFLYGIEMYIDILELNPDFMEVDYYYDWESEDMPIRSIKLTTVTTDDEQIEELIKDQLKTNYLKNLK